VEVISKMNYCSKLLSLTLFSKLTPIAISVLFLVSCTGGDNGAPESAQADSRQNISPSAPTVNTKRPTQPSVQTKTAKELMAQRVALLPIPSSIDEIVGQFEQIDKIESKQEEELRVIRTFQAGPNAAKEAAFLKKRVSEEQRLERLMDFVNLMGLRSGWNKIDREQVINRDLQLIKYLVRSLQSVRSKQELPNLQNYFAGQITHLFNDDDDSDNPQVIGEQKIERKRIVSVYFSLEYLLNQDLVVQLIGSQALKVKLSDSASSASDLLAHRAFFLSLKAANGGSKGLLPAELDPSLIRSAHSNAIWALKCYVAGKIDRSRVLEQMDHYFFLLDYPVKRFRPDGLPEDHKRLLSFGEEYLTRVVTALDSREQLLRSLEQVLSAVETEADQNILVWPRHPLTQMTVVQAAVNRSNIAGALLQFFNDDYQQFSKSYDDGLGSKYWSETSALFQHADVADTNINRATLYRYHQYNYYKNQFFIQQLQILRMASGVELSDVDRELIAEVVKSARQSQQYQNELRRPYDQWMEQVMENLRRAAKQYGLGGNTGVNDNSSAFEYLPEAERRYQEITAGSNNLSGKYLRMEQLN
jgi:hypothetical protein